MKIGLLLPSVGNETWQAYRAITALKKAVTDAGHEAVMYTPQKVMVALGKDGLTAFEDGSGIELCDVLLVRVFFHEEIPAARLLARYLESRGAKIVNGGLFRLMDEAKFILMQRLSESNIPMPQSVFLSTKADLSHVDTLLSYPLIMKILDGTGGKGVVLIESAKALSSVLDLFWLKSPGTPVMLQEYVSGSEGRDRRLFVVGDKVVAAMERTSKGKDFRSNLHSGGEAAPVDPTDDEMKTAVSAANCLGLDIAGVDLLKSKDGPLVIDVNPNPGILKTSAASGVDIASKIVEFILRSA